MASFDETGSPGNFAFHEFKVVGAEVHAVMIAHFGSFFQPGDILRLKEGWRYEVFKPTGVVTTPLRNVTVEQFAADRPYCRVTVNMGSPAPGVLLWSSDSMASVNSFSKSYVGRSSVYPEPTRVGSAWGEHGWVLAGAFALLLLSLIIGGRQTVLVVPQKKDRREE